MWLQEPHLWTSVRCHRCDHCKWASGSCLQTSWWLPPSLETTGDKGCTIPHSTMGGSAWQRAGLEILLWVQLLHRAVCNVNLIQSPQTFHGIRHILSPFPEPPREPSLVACQTSSTPYVWSSVSVVGCHPPTEPHVQSSGCEMKEIVVGGKVEQRDSANNFSGNGRCTKSTQTDLGRSEEKKHKNQKQRQTLLSYFLPFLICVAGGWRLIAVLGPLIINPYVKDSAVRLGPSLLNQWNLMLLNLPSQLATCFSLSLALRPWAHFRFYLFCLLMPVSSGGGLILEIKVLIERFFSFLSLGRAGNPEDFINHTFPCALLHLFCLACLWRL